MVYLVRAIVFAVKEVLAQVDADGEVLLAGVHLGLQTLVVVHQQLNSRHVAWLLLGVHLPRDVIHPEQQVTHHVEEAVQVAGVGQLESARVHQVVEVAPGVQHFLLLLLDLLLLGSGIADLQARGFLLDGSHLQPDMWSSGTYCLTTASGKSDNHSIDSNAKKGLTS